HIIAANIDQALLVITVNFPRLNIEFVDRFLVAAEAYKIPVRIIINKQDLCSKEDLILVQKIEYIYTKIGYNVTLISVKENKNIDVVKKLIDNKISLLSGNSGVGKSSLINALNDGLDLRVGEISDYHNKGKHTTTFSEMIEITSDSYIIDTPGLKGFGFVDLKREEIYHYFPEIFSTSSVCKFANCTHIHEPKCAVLDAVDCGQISASRYQSYLKIMSTSDDAKYR
ncbi:MAG: ribosome small subunit-dependent GTPase A, partial [Bacteroidales bacterium]